MRVVAFPLFTKCTIKIASERIWLVTNLLTSESRDPKIFIQSILSFDSLCTETRDISTGWAINQDPFRLNLNICILFLALRCDKMEWVSTAVAAPDLLSTAGNGSCDRRSESPPPAWQLQGNLMFQSINTDTLQFIIIKNISEGNWS